MGSICVNKKLSVIVPAYNNSIYIKKCIESVINQTYQNIELIIIDDCSTIDIKSAIQEYLDNDPRIVFKRNEVNCGPGVSRNLGIDLATGEYLTFIDHDDYQNLDRYEKMLKILEKTGLDVCMSYAREYYQKTDKYKTLPFPKYNKETITLDKRNIFYFIPPWAKIYKTSFIKNNKIKFAVNRVLFDDLLFHSLVIHNISRVALCCEENYVHRFTPKSISGTCTDAFELLVNDHLDSFQQALAHPLLNNTNNKDVVYFFNQLIIELIENCPLASEKKLRATYKQFLKDHDIYPQFNSKLFRRKLIRIKLGKNKKIIRILGIYLYKIIS